MPSLMGTAGPDVLSATAGSTEKWTLSGLDGDDVLNGADGDDVLDGGPGADIMRGYWGNDIYYVDNIGDVVEDGAGNEIRTTLASYSLPTLIYRLTGLLTTGQVLTGNYSDNIITGNAGDDRLWGGAGIDQLIGGAGNDTYILKDYDSDRSDTIVETANNGIDEVLVGLGSYTLAANVENATATGANISLTGNSLANVLRGSSFNDTLDGGTGADTMIGGAGSDFYYVDNAGDVIVESLDSNGGTGDTIVTAFSYYQLQAGVELLQGTAAQQTLVGNSGDNWLLSKGGGDTLIGGLGNDLYEIQAGDIIVENANEGIDLVRTTMASYTLPEHLEELQGTSFTTSQTLIGNAADNRIIGTLLNNQSDIIDGGAGADRMYGWHGSDIYYVDNVLDYIEEEAHHGTADQVRTTVNYTLPTNIEILVAWVDTGLTLTGNSLANTLIGGNGADRLIGNLGADILEGGLGADTFVYLSSADSTGSATDRIRAFQSGVDLIDLNALGQRTISWTELTDPADSTLYSLVTVTVGAATMKIRVDGHIVLQDFTEVGQSLAGTSGNDILTGGSGNDQLDGGGGADVMTGKGGNDIYVVDDSGDQVIEGVNGGSDLVYTSVSYALAAGQEIEALSTRDNAGMEAINLLGNEFGQTVVGNAGANVINGGGGADVMAGLAGDDTYVVDRVEDQVLEGVGQGNDAIFTSTSYVLSSNQEIETLTTQTHAGTDDLFLTGNQLNNTLIGNAGDNILNGVGGADVMIGLDGDDTYAIDDLGDLVIDLENQGNDLVLTYLSHTLSNGNQIETLSTVFHQGTDAINLGGNDYNNTLIGNYGANYLNGNGGVDVMIGLNGNDTYVADNVGDVVQEVAGGGADLLYSFVSYTLAAGQEVETISTAVQGGTTAIDLTGNEFAQTIVGNAGANMIDGKSGSDVLYGLGGADTFVFTTALGAGNVDTLADFVAGTDKIGLDDAIFTAIGGTLNASAFVIGTAAGDADDRIIYNQATGQLFYDADGNGGGAAILFATLSGAPVLGASDFQMI